MYEKLLAFIEGIESGQASPSEKKSRERKCHYCGRKHVLGKIFCKAAGHICKKCGRKNHFETVCRKSEMSKKNGEHAEVEASWACGVLQGSAVATNSQYTNENVHSSHNKTPDPNKASFLKKIYSKEVKNNFEKIGVTHPGLIKRGKNKNKRPNKKVGLPTLVNDLLPVQLVKLAMTLMTGSVILSSLPSQRGNLSNAQVAYVSQGKLVIGHHVFSKGRGWLRQAARVKPMIALHSRIDMSAYKALGLKPPAKQAKSSEGQHLADTGASICLGGKTYLRSLGLSEQDLTPCDMTVCGANSSNIQVLGALLVEFSHKQQLITPGVSQPTSKQIV